MKTQIHHVLAKTPLLVRVVSLYVVAGSMLGVYLSVLPPVEAITAPSAVTPAQVVKADAPAENRRISGLPRSVELPRSNLSLEVINGSYNAVTRGWTLTDDKAQFATMTTPINDQSGQTMIYGHNTPAVFEPVRSVEPGDELRVTTDTGKIFTYTYVRDRYVEPTDVSVLYETPHKPTVVLMTCEGWLSTERRLLYFEFKEVQ